MTPFCNLWIAFIMIGLWGSRVNGRALEEDKIKIFFEATAPINVHAVKIELTYEFKTGCVEENLSKVYRNCSEVPTSLGSGVYNISISGQLIEVFCEIDENGTRYLIIQRRINGSQDFYRNWTEYENGFGNLNHEFWIGNKALHLITSQANYKLRIDLEAADSTKVYAVYDHFSIGSPETKYKLNISDYSGNAGDSLKVQNGQMFSTFDQDNDEYSGGNCAVLYKGAWWYQRCHSSNLNGFYYGGPHSSYADGVNWQTFRGHYESMKTAIMKIKLT